MAPTRGMDIRSFFDKPNGGAAASEAEPDKSDPYKGGLSSMAADDSVPYAGGAGDDSDQSDLDMGPDTSSTSQGSDSTAPDPFRLRRFTSEQVHYHPIALSEMKRG